MSNCKNCNKPIEVTKGRRPREFCDNNQKCRNEWFRKNKKEKNFKLVPIEVYREMELAMIKINHKGESLGCDVSELINKGENKPQETSKIEKPHNLPQKEKEASVASENSVGGKPKALNELKALCPPELTGFYRSEWIRENRLRYKI